MLQMSAFQLKTLLNAECKVVDNVCPLPLEDQIVKNPLPLIFINAMSFKVLDQLENINHVWKYVEIEIPANLESFVLRN